MTIGAADLDSTADVFRTPVEGAFGANVTVRAEGDALFFLIGREGPPDAPVGAVGGRVVAHLGDPRRVLAIAPLAAYELLIEHPDLRLAGPVAIDRERFERFARLIGLGRHSPAGPAAPDPVA